MESIQRVSDSHTAGRGGFVKIGDELEPSTVEPILGVETWERAMRVFEHRRRGPDKQGRKTKVPFVADRPLSVTCGVCGNSMARRVERSGAASDVCPERETHKACTALRVRREVVDGALARMFETDILDEQATIRELGRAADAAVASARAALAHAEAR